MTAEAPTAGTFEALRVAIGAATAGWSGPGSAELQREYVEGLQRDMGPERANTYLRKGAGSLINVLLFVLERHGVDPLDTLAEISARFVPNEAR